MQKGFTIVELLIVIVVIGILAAIVIVASNGVQSRANDSAVQADLKNMAALLNNQATLSASGGFPTTLTAAMGLKASRGAYAIDRNNLYYCADNNGNAFALTAMSKSGKAYTVRSNSPVKSYTGSYSGQTSCTDAGLATTDWRASGYDFSGGTGWASWMNP